MSAKVIWAGNRKYQEYKLDTFRMRLNRIKQDMRDAGELLIRMLFYNIVLQRFSIILLILSNYRI